MYALRTYFLQCARTKVFLSIRDRDASSVLEYSSRAQYPAQTWNIRRDCARIPRVSNLSGIFLKVHHACLVLLKYSGVLKHTVSLKL